MFEIEIEGLDELKLNLETVCANVDSALKSGLKELGLGIRDTAAANCTADTGQLRNSITCKVVKKDDGYEATIGTNSGHAPYVEFGTGPRGQNTPVPNKYPKNISYRQTPWWIHEDQLSESARKKYRWFKITIGDDVFYKSEGQPAQPFLYPAFLEHRSRAASVISNHIRGALGLD